MYQALRENEAMKATGGLPFKLGQVVPCTHPSYINCCSRATKAPKKLAAEGIFDEVGTPTFAIDVISQHDMAFALRSLGNPAYARGAHGDQHGCADPRKTKAAAVLAGLMATDE